MVDANQAPTDLAGLTFGPDLPQPGEALAAFAPTQQLQQWAVAARTAEGVSPPVDVPGGRGLSLDHFVELMRLVDSGAWAKLFASHAPLGKARTLCAWLRHLGAPLPPPCEIDTPEAGYFLTKCRRAAKQLGVPKGKPASPRPGEASSNRDAPGAYVQLPAASLLDAMLMPVLRKATAALRGTLADCALILGTPAADEPSGASSSMQPMTSFSDAAEC